MKIKNYIAMNLICLSSISFIIFAGSEKQRPERKDAPRQIVEKKTGITKPEPKRAPKLEPTETKVRVFYNDETKQPEGVEVIICQGKCTGRTSVPYEKNVHKMQEEALKLVHQGGLVEKMKSAMETEKSAE